MYKYKKLAQLQMIGRLHQMTKMCKTMAEYPVLLLIPLVIILAHMVVRSSRRRGSGSLCRPPPGPWALPVIGHLHHLVGALPPHHKLRALSRRHGPLMLLRFGELPVVVASSAAAAREILMTHDLAFATRPVTRTARLGLGDGGVALTNAPYGDAWRQLRKTCTVELLSARRVRSFRAVREQEVARLLQAVAAAASAPAAAVNLSRRISSCVADSTARAIIGSRFPDRATFFRLLDEALRLFSKPSLPDLYPSSRLALLASRAPARMKRLQVEMMAFMDTVIRDHQLRREPTAAAADDDDDDEEEDLVDVLLRIHSDGGISMDTIKAVVADLFIAGSETSATLLQWAMSELVRNPAAMRAAQDDVRRVVGGSGLVTEACLGELWYLSLVVKETLRLHPPVPLLLPRECRRPCRVLGLDVPVGATVLVNVWAVGRDPAHWGEDHAPEEFVPERFLQGGSGGVDFRGADVEFLPFGAGRRMCPGLAFGLANVELALASLLYHFDWKLPAAAEDGGRLDMAEVLEVTARRRADLVLVPVVHVPVPAV